MPQIKSIKINFILNWCNTLLGIIFPIITFPYIARVIGPDGLGIISFDQAILKYISVISSLGISFYAVRHISRFRNNIQLQNHYAVEILLLHVLLTILGYVAVAVIYFFVPQVNTQGFIFLVLSLTLIFNALGVVWYFQAREDFLFLTTRSLFVKLVMTIALFVFVKDSDDLILYAWILALTEILNNLLNFLRLRHFIKFRDIQWRKLKIFSHFKSAVVLFSMSVIMTLYADLPTVFLGMDAQEVNVGYYYTAIKLESVMLSFVMALSASLLPRMSHLFAQGLIQQFRDLEHKSMTFSIGLSLPLCIGSLIIAPEIITCFASDEFLPSISVMRIIAPTIPAIAVAGVVGFHVLYPQGRENDIIKSAVVGLIVAATFNFILVPRMVQDGAALAYLFTELSVTVSMIFFGRRYLAYNYCNKSVLKYIISVAAMSAVVLVLHEMLCVDALLKLLLEAAVGAVVYVIMLFALREAIFVELLNSLLLKIRHR